MPDYGRTAYETPAPDGLTASGRLGLYLRAAGYVPVGSGCCDESESSPLAADRLSGTERRQPRCAPDPAEW